MPPPPCKFFSAGFCRNGSKCKFSHDASALYYRPERGLQYGLVTPHQIGPPTHSQGHDNQRRDFDPHFQKDHSHHKQRQIYYGGNCRERKNERMHIVARNDHPNFDDYCGRRGRDEHHSSGGNHYNHYPKGNAFDNHLTDSIENSPLKPSCYQNDDQSSAQHLPPSKSCTPKNHNHKWSECPNIIFLKKSNRINTQQLDSEPGKSAVAQRGHHNGGSFQYSKTQSAITDNDTSPIIEYNSNGKPISSSQTRKTQYPSQKPNHSPPEKPVQESNAASSHGESDFASQATIAEKLKVKATCSASFCSKGNPHTTSSLSTGSEEVGNTANSDSIFRIPRNSLTKTNNNYVLSKYVVPPEKMPPKKPPPIKSHSGPKTSRNSCIEFGTSKSNGVRFAAQESFRIHNIPKTASDISANASSLSLNKNLGNSYVSKPSADDAAASKLFNTTKSARQHIPRSQRALGQLKQSSSVAETKLDQKQRSGEIQPQFAKKPASKPQPAIKPTMKQTANNRGQSRNPDIFQAAPLGHNAIPVKSHKHSRITTNASSKSFGIQQSQRVIVSERTHDDMSISDSSSMSDPPSKKLKTKENNIQHRVCEKSTLDGHHLEGTEQHQIRSPTLTAAAGELGKMQRLGRSQPHITTKPSPKPILKAQLAVKPPNIQMTNSGDRQPEVSQCDHLGHDAEATNSNRLPQTYEKPRSKADAASEHPFSDDVTNSNSSAVSNPQYKNSRNYPHRASLPESVIPPDKSEIVLNGLPLAHSTPQTMQRESSSGSRSKANGGNKDAPLWNDATSSTRSDIILHSTSNRIQSSASKSLTNNVLHGENLLSNVPNKEKRQSIRLQPQCPELREASQPKRGQTINASTIEVLISNVKASQSWSKDEKSKNVQSTDFADTTTRPRSNNGNDDETGIIRGCEQNNSPASSKSEESKVQKESETSGHGNNSQSQKRCSESVIDLCDTSDDGSAVDDSMHNDTCGTAGAKNVDKSVTVGVFSELPDNIIAEKSRKSKDQATQWGSMVRQSADRCNKLIKRGETKIHEESDVTGNEQPHQTELNSRLTNGRFCAELEPKDDSGRKGFEDGEKSQGRELQGREGQNMTTEIKAPTNALNFSERSLDKESSEKNVKKVRLLSTKNTPSKQERLAIERYLQKPNKGSVDWMRDEYTLITTIKKLITSDTNETADNYQHRNGSYETTMQVMLKQFEQDWNVRQISVEPDVSSFRKQPMTSAKEKELMKRQHRKIDKEQLEQERVEIENMTMETKQLSEERRRVDQGRQSNMTEEEFQKKRRVRLDEEQKKIKRMRSVTNQSLVEHKQRDQIGAKQTEEHLRKRTDEKHLSNENERLAEDQKDSELQWQAKAAGMTAEKQVVEQTRIEVTRLAEEQRRIEQERQADAATKQAGEQRLERERIEDEQRKIENKRSTKERRRGEHGRQAKETTNDAVQKRREEEIRRAEKERWTELRPSVEQERQDRTVEEQRKNELNENDQLVKEGSRLEGKWQVERISRLVEEEHAQKKETEKETSEGDEMCAEYTLRAGSGTTKPSEVGMRITDYFKEPSSQRLFDEGHDESHEALFPQIEQKPIEDEYDFSAMWCSAFKDAKLEISNIEEQDESNLTTGHLEDEDDEMSQDRQRTTSQMHSLSREEDLAIERFLFKQKHLENSLQEKKKINELERDLLSIVSYSLKCSLVRKKESGHNSLLSDSPREHSETLIPNIDTSFARKTFDARTDIAGAFNFFPHDIALAPSGDSFINEQEASLKAVRPNYGLELVENVSTVHCAERESLNYSNSHYIKSKTFSLHKCKTPSIKELDTCFEVDMPDIHEEENSNLFGVTAPDSCSNHDPTEVHGYNVGARALPSAQDCYGSEYVHQVQINNSMSSIDVRVHRNGKEINNLENASKEKLSSDEKITHTGENIDDDPGYSTTNVFQRETGSSHSTKIQQALNQCTQCPDTLKDVVKTNRTPEISKTTLKSNESSSSKESRALLMSSESLFALDTDDVTPTQDALNEKDLNEVGVDCRRRNKNEKWEMYYGELVKFKNSYGHLQVPKEFKPNDASLGFLQSWVHRQKRNHKEGKLSCNHAEKLIKLGIEMEDMKQTSNENNLNTEGRLNEENTGEPYAMNLVDNLCSTSFDENGLPRQYVTIICGDSEMLYDFQIDIRESTIPNAGNGAFLTFLGARKLKKQAAIRSERLLKQHVIEDMAETEPLTAILPGGLGIGVTITGQNLYRNDNNRYWSKKRVKLLSDHSQNDTVSSGFDENSVQCEIHQEVLKLRSKVEDGKRIGFLGIHSESDYVEANDVLFWSGPESMFEIGRYGPIRPEDRKTELHFSMKNFIHDFKPAEWSYDVDEKIMGDCQLIDITDDATGEVHSEAKKHTPIYVNEIGHKKNLCANVRIMHKNDRSVYYYACIEKEHAMKKGDCVELLVDYGKLYENVRERKGYGVANLYHKVDDDSDRGAKLQRNFAARKSIESEISKLSIVRLFYLAEFLMERIFPEINESIQDIFRQDVSSQLKSRSLVARRRLHWIGERLEQQLEKCFGSLQRVYFSSKFITSIQNIIHSFKWSSLPGVFSAIQDTESDIPNICAKDCILNEISEELLYKVSHMIPKPFDTKIWSQLGNLLIESVTKKIAIHVFCSSETSMEERQTKLGRSVLDDAERYSKLTIRCSTVLDGSATDSHLYDNFFNILSFNSPPHKVNQNQFFYNRPNNKKPRTIYDAKQTINFGTASALAEVQAYQDAIDVGFLEPHAIPGVLKNLFEYEKSIVCKYPSTSPNSTIGRLPQFYWMARGAESIKKGTAKVNVEWYLMNQLLLVVHLLASNCVEWKASSQKMVPYSLERLCEAVGVEVNAAKTALSNGFILPDWPEEVTVTRGSPSSSVANQDKSSKRGALLDPSDEFPGWTVKQVPRQGSSQVDKYWYHPSLSEVTFRSRVGVRAVLTQAEKLGVDLRTALESIPHDDRRKWCTGLKTS